MILYIKVIYLIEFFYSNIRKIEHGIGYDFLVMFQTLLFIIGSFIISFVFNWQLSLIMICILPLVLGASFLFSKVKIVTQSIKFI